MVTKTQGALAPLSLVLLRVLRRQAMLEAQERERERRRTRRRLIGGSVLVGVIAAAAAGGTRLRSRTT